MSTITLNERILDGFELRIPQTVMRHIIHYTNAEALKSIIEHRKLWASKSDFLNDYSEISYIEEIFDNLFLFVQKNYKEEIVRFFELIKNSLNTFLNKKKSGDEEQSIYIISFSENQDSLALWSNYTKGEGYNLIFDTEEMFELIEYSQKKIVNTIFAGKIIYDESEQIKILFEELMRIYNILEELSDPLSEEDIDDAIQFCQTLIEFYAMFFKKPGFVQEEEYRLAFVIRNDGTLKELIKYRTANGSLIPYIEISIDEPSCPLFGVTIGPKNSIDTSAMGLKHFLETKDLPNVSRNIYKSAIPLRF